jgi:hypothetical protein
MQDNVLGQRLLELREERDDPPLANALRDDVLRWRESIALNNTEHREQGHRQLKSHNRRECHEIQLQNRNGIDLCYYVDRDGGGFC